MNNPNETTLSSQIEQDNSTDIRHLARLSDFIFALAMALIVIAFDIPDQVENMTNREINAFLISQLQPLATYAVTFALIAFYWISHSQQFSYLRRTNVTHLWISVIYLMGLFLVPLSNDLVMTFPHNFGAKLWFSLNIAAIGFASSISWWYATRDRQLVDGNLDESTIRSVQVKMLIEPVFALVSLGVAYWSQTAWDYSWIVLLFAYNPLERLLIEIIRSNDFNLTP
ncbi:TMEM175 family protein [Alkalinema pantanalense CENA528]|uniref:TMEM175 family protein n=1 Tax=Alkalinema pantanalense TaxID=1620705 RepID=UPI003D6E3D65